MAKRRAKFGGSRFVSGRLKLNVKFNDNDTYSVKLCPTERGARCETVVVGAPSSGPTNVRGKRIAYDDARAMRSAAAAAISHSNRNMADYADYNRRGSGYLIKPAVRPRRKR